VLLAALFFVTGVHVTAVAALNGVLAAVVVLVSAEWLREATGSAGPWSDVVAVLLVLPCVLLGSDKLMEVALALAILLTGALLHLRGSRWSLAVVGLSVFARPEFAVFFLLFGLEDVRRLGWREAGRRGAAAALVAAPLVLFLLHYFGTLIPNTIHAKSVVYVMSLSQVLGQLPGDLHAPIGLPPLVGGTLWTLAAAGIVRWGVAAEDRRGAWLVDGAILGIGALVIPIVYLARRVFVFWWYPPLYEVPLALVLGALLMRVRGVRRNVGLGLAFLFPFVPVLLSVLLAASSTHRALEQLTFRRGARSLEYIRLGRYLAEVAPHARLMAAEIGGLGFGFDGKIYDGVGLVTPGALAYHPLKVPEQRSGGNVGAIPAAYIREVDPDIIVGYPLFLTDFLGSDLVSRYSLESLPVFSPQLSKGFPSPLAIWGQRHILVFTKVGHG